MEGSKNSSMQYNYTTIPTACAAPDAELKSRHQTSGYKALKLKMSIHVQYFHSKSLQS